MMRHTTDGSANLGAQFYAMYQDILRMSTLVEEALRKTLVAITRHDLALAKTVHDGDQMIDDLQFQIDERCTRMIASRQPAMGDRREMLVAMRIAGDLERIGDHAGILVRMADKLHEERFFTALPSVTAITETGIGMLHDSITAYVNHDVDLAKTVALRDQEIARLHLLLYGEIVRVIRDRPERVEQWTSLVFTNRFLERLGDHITDMCEWIVYAQTGFRVELGA